MQFLKRRLQLLNLSSCWFVGLWRSGCGDWMWSSMFQKEKWNQWKYCCEWLRKTIHSCIFKVVSYFLACSNLQAVCRAMCCVQKRFVCWFWTSCFMNVKHIWDCIFLIMILCSWQSHVIQPAALLRYKFILNNIPRMEMTSQPNK